jgi:muconolactone D-isomerase
MKEVLVEITATIPEGTEQAEVAPLRAGEAVRAAELVGHRAPVPPLAPGRRAAQLGIRRATDEPDLQDKVLGTTRCARLVPGWPGSARPMTDGLTIALALSPGTSRPTSSRS